MSVPLVDSHVNLHDEKFQDDLPEVIERAHEVGITHMLNICCNISDFEKVVKVADDYDHIWATVGTHPHDAKDNPGLRPSDLVDLTTHPKVVAIGETGFDFHYGYSNRADQIRNFDAHMDAASQTGLPLVIHTREADDLMQDALSGSGAGADFPALMHCYTSGEDLAKWAAEQGFYFSVSGIATFKNAKDVRARIEDMPEERIMLETDCPYLAPVPYRGRRNEPAFLPYVAEALSDIRGWSLDKVSTRTNDAFFRFFSKIEP